MNLIDAICANGWAMHRRTLDELLAVVDRHERGEKVDAASLAEIVRQRDAMFRDRMNAYGEARFPEALTSEEPRSVARMAALEESPMAPSVVVESAAQGKSPSYFMVQDVAVVPVQGVLAKHSSMVNGMSQPVGMAYSQIARAVATAANDPKAKSILLDIHSPGGMVHGVQDAYSEIDSKGKPVVAYAHDMAASAAYWLASAADKVVLSPSASVGSIGVYCIVEDTSKQLADRKISRTVISSGPYKGAGAGGTPLNAEQISAIQQEVNAEAAQFSAYVGKRRGMNADQMAAVSDGRMWTGPDAVKMGLADKVVTPREAIAYAQNLAAGRLAGGGGGTGTKSTTQRGTLSGGTNKKGSNMDWETLSDSDVSGIPAAALARITKAHNLTPAPTAASIEELETAFPGEPAFVLASAKQKLPVLNAKAEFATVLAERLDASGKKNAELTQANADLSAKLATATQTGRAPLAPAGVQPVAAGPASAATGLTAFAARVGEIQKEKNIDRGAAMAAMATGSKEDKALYATWREAGCPELK